MQKNTKNPNLNKFAELARIGEVVFHTDDLANLWHINNKNTLYTAVKRYVSQGLLFRLQKGLYSLKPVNEIDTLFLGIKGLHGYSYVSTETILAEEGIIQQVVPSITLVSGTAKRFSIGNSRYISRKLDDIFLHQPTGIVTEENGVRKATVERAVADLLYFNKNAYFDAANLLDWDKVKTTQKEIGYPLTPKRYV